MERIVVGVDGSSGARVALAWAVDVASRHDAAVVALLAWSYRDQHHADAGDDFDPRYGKVYRLRPRDNADVNRFWMCDQGMMTYREVHERRERDLEGEPAHGEHL